MKDFGQLMAVFFEAMASDCFNQMSEKGTRCSVDINQEVIDQLFKGYVAQLNPEPKRVYLQNLDKVAEMREPVTLMLAMVIMSQVDTRFSVNPIGSESDAQNIDARKVTAFKVTFEP